MLPLDWISVVGNTIFLLSYGVFVLHIFRTKSVEGVSGIAVSMWWLGFSLLAVFFFKKWMYSGLSRELMFIAYYAAGSVLSIVALIMLWVYKDGRT